MLIGPDEVVNDREVVAVLDWVAGRESQDNRALVSYARAHGFLREGSGEPQSLVITGDRLFLTPVGAATLRKRMSPNIVSPPGDGMLR